MLTVMMVGRIMMPSSTAAGKQAHALAALDVEHGFEERRLDHGLHGGHKHDHAEEAVDDGRDAGQQLHRREHDLIDAGRRELGHVDGRQQADGHADEDSPPAVT